MVKTETKNKVKISIYLDDNVSADLRMQAVREKTNLSKLVQKTIIEYLKRKK